MNKTKVHIGQTQLLDLLMNIDKSQFNFLVTTTKVRMRKTNNPYFDKVLKKKKITVLPVTDYEGRVNKINGTDDFTSQPSTVGVHVSECVIHNERLNRYYFNYEFFGVNTQTTTYSFNDQPIEKNVFDTFTPNRNYDPTKPKFNSVMLTNIKEISLNKIHYIVDLD